MNHYWVYMITNTGNTVLYTGVTNNLERRMYEHKNKLIKGFSEKYNLHKLVHCEETNDVNAAIAREKQIKGWLRSKKNALVNENNPEWRDLSSGWHENPSPTGCRKKSGNCHPERSEGSLFAAWGSFAALRMTKT